MFKTVDKDNRDLIPPSENGKEHAMHWKRLSNPEVEVKLQLSSGEWVSLQARVLHILAREENNPSDNG